MAERVYVVRHGQDEDNAALLLNGHRDKPLTATGVAQAKTVARRMASLGIDVIVASPLQRARCTAEEIKVAAGVSDANFFVKDEMKERDFGVLTGQPVAAIKDVAGDKVLQTEKVTYFLDVEGSEPFPVLLERARGVLAYVNETFPGKKVALVGHGDLNKMIRAAYLGWTWEQGLQTAYVGNTDVIQLPPSCTDPGGVMQFED